MANYTAEESGLSITEENRYKVLCNKYNAVFNSDNGIDVLNDIIRISGYNSKITAYTKIGEIDVNQMLINEGARQLLIEILNRIEHGKPRIS